MHDRKVQEHGKKAQGHDRRVQEHGNWVQVRDMKVLVHDTKVLDDRIRHHIPSQAWC